ncbi:MAG: VWA domain-containing protein [Phycisphaeraceae bacterium]|nr:MAG: VWA domain-containing protein [Phycisphaeraceae bacterium]
MTFLHPAIFIAGVAAVSIPILIHLLLRQRRKPIPWAAMRFLLEAFRRQRRRLRVQQWLLLATRCLIVLLLAAAIARPLIDAAGALFAGSGRDVYFLVDESLTASLRTGNTTALDRAKEQADRILGAMGEGDRAGLITLSAPASPVVIPASPDLGAIRQLIRNLEPTEARADIPGALESLGARLRAIAAADAARETVVILLSDLLSGSADPTRPLPSVLADIDRVRLLAPEPRTTPGSNITITGVDPQRSVVLTGRGRASEPVPVRVTLRRSGAGVGEEAVSTIRVRLVTASGDGETITLAQEARTGIRWSPGQSEASASLTVEVVRPADDTLAARTTQAMLIAEIDRDDLDADNTFRRPIGVVDALEIGVVAPRRFTGAIRSERLAPADWLRFALQPSEGAPITIRDLEPGAIDAAALATLDALFLPDPDLIPQNAWPRLRAFVDAGGLVIVSPPSETSVHLWTDLFLDTFDLEWTIAREAETHAEPLRLAPEQPQTGLLSQVAGELRDLLSPVSVERFLPATPNRAGATDILVLADGRPLILAESPTRSIRAPGRNGAAPGAGVEDNSGAAAPTDTEDPVAAGRGLVVYLGVAPALEWTDLPARPLMVPLVQELVRQGVGETGAILPAVAGRPALAPPGAARLLTPTPIEVDASGIIQPPLRRAGRYSGVDAAGRGVGILAVNADAEAGRVEPLDSTAVRAWLSGAGGEEGEMVAWLPTEDVARVFTMGDERAGISMPLLWAALLLALAETIMARFFSHAFREPSGTPVAA